MKGNLINCKCGLWIGLVLFAASTAAAESYTSDEIPLLVELGTENNRVVVGEPAYITARLRNMGNKEVLVPRVLEWQSAKLQLQITQSHGETLLFSPLFYADTTIPKLSLAPGEQLEQVMPVFFGSAGWTFREAGTYRLTLRYHHKSGTEITTIQSNPISIAVTDEDDSSAFLVNDSKSSFTAGKFLFWQQGDHLTEGIRILNELTEQYPDSLLANYARFALARNLSRGFRNYAIGKFRKADCPQALELFGSVQVQLLPSYLQIKMDTDLKRCLSETQSQ